MPTEATLSEEELIEQYVPQAQAVVEIAATVPFYVATVGRFGRSRVITSQPSGINCGTQCKIEVRRGTQVTLTVTPNANSQFLLWAGACNGKSTTCTVTGGKLSFAVAFFAKATQKK